VEEEREGRLRLGVVLQEVLCAQNRGKKATHDVGSWRALLLRDKEQTHSVCAA
jgi:hypothetical protein